MNPFQAGMLDWKNWTQSTTQKNIYCQTGHLDTSRFHNYSDILVSVSAVVDGGGHSGFSYLLKSVRAWVAAKDRDSFSACYSYTSHPGQEAIHNDSSKVKVKMHFVAYQKNMHRRMSHVEGDEVALPSWKNGIQCTKVKTKVCRLYVFICEVITKNSDVCQ